MLKSISKLELKIGEKLYEFMCDHDSPVEHVKEALCQFIKYAGNVEDAVKQARQQQEEAEKSQESAQTPDITEVANGEPAA